MDSSEQLAEAYLKGLDLGEVVYEPDGNIPPDFLVGGRIAVEVRRLNQNFEHEDRTEGLETVAAALDKYFRNLLPTFGPQIDGQSWFVTYRFKRPLDWQQVKRLAREALAEFHRAPTAENWQQELGPGLRLRFTRAANPHAHFFVLGGRSDGNAGGWVVSEMIRNLELCITEKSRKVAPYRARYPEWWLVLPDMIGLGLDRDERGQLRGAVGLEGWDKVILLSPYDPVSTFAL